MNTYCDTQIHITEDCDKVRKGTEFFLCITVCYICSDETVQDVGLVRETTKW